MTHGTVRSVVLNDDDTWLVAVRWDDGTLTETVWHDDLLPQMDDRVLRADD